VEVNGETIDNANKLATVVGLMQIGDRLKIKLIRDGEQRTVTAEVGDPKAHETSAGNIHPALDGATFSELDERSPLFGKVEGVLVSDVESATKAAEYLRPGDVITSVNRKPVSSLQEFRERVSGEERLLLNIRRGNAAMFVLVK
jgi:S1-C subfamily serine protease